MSSVVQISRPSASSARPTPLAHVELPPDWRHGPLLGHAGRGLRTARAGALDAVGGEQERQAHWE